MIKKILVLILAVLVFFLGIQSAFSLSTYVGVEILNLTDDPASSCAGEAGYGSQGRIRALSSIVPDYPIYFNLTYAGNGTEIWSGDSTEDIDYEIGDVIYIPSLVNMQSGIDYNLFFDIDAIRIYLPLVDSGSFEATLDDNYWTTGKAKTSLLALNWFEQPFYYSGASNCDFGAVQTGNQREEHGYLVSNIRNGTLDDNCIADQVSFSCDSSYQVSVARGSIGYSNNDFNMDRKYENLQTTSAGNINMAFTFP